MKSLFFVIGAGVLATNAMIGCSADDSRIGYDENVEDGGSKAALPETGSPSPATEDAASPSDDDKPKPGDKDAGDTGNTDSGSDAGNTGDTGRFVDAGADTGAVDTNPVIPDNDAGAPGSACATKDAVQQQSCGLCGVQYRLCAPSDSTPGSPNVWQPWGYCQNEVEGGCVPGSTTTENCGLCGNRQKVCQNDCRWAAGACKNEPANACSPGTEQYQVGLSCGEGGRKRVCQNNCTYGAFGECFVPGKPTLTLATAVGKKVTGEFTLDPAFKAGRLDGTCPNGTISTTQAPYQYVLLANPSSSALTVSVWTGKSSKPGAGYIDTVMASYASDVEPTTDAARKACVKGRNDGCSDSDSTACISSWAGLVGSDKVTVPANGKIVIYVGAWSDSYSGDYMLTARTDAVAD